MDGGNALLYQLFRLIFFLNPIKFQNCTQKTLFNEKNWFRNILFLNLNSLNLT